MLYQFLSDELLPAHLPDDLLHLLLLLRQLL